MAMKLPSINSVRAPSAVEEALDLMRILAENSATGIGEQESTDASSASALQNAMAQADLSARLRFAVEQAASKSAESMDTLRLAVCAFTLALRDEGITPEAVLIRLKVAIHAETLAPLWSTSSWSGQHLHDTITTWCIRDYFSEKDCVEASR